MAEEKAILTDGSCSWDGGIDSIKVSTVSGPDNPNGLTRQQLAWLNNGTVRTGGIAPRDSWIKKGNVLAGLPYLVGKLFQGEFDYVPQTGNPYKIYVIGGHVLKVDPDFITAPVDLSEVFNFTFPAPLASRVFFCQAITYLVIQAGDFNPNTGLGTLPFIWNGTTLTQSNGLTGITTGFQQPVQYGFTPISPGFVVPAVGSSVTFTANTPYTGLVLFNLALYAQASNVQEFIGEFQVTAVTGNSMTLKTVSLSGSTRGVAGATIITPCVLESTPGAAGDTVTYSANVFTGLGTPTSVSPATIPSAGGSQTWVFGGGLDNPAPANGSYNIILDLNLNVLGMVSITSNTGGATPTIIVDWMFVCAPVGTSLPYVTFMPESALTPAVGSSFKIPTLTTYGGSIGDTVILTGSTILSPNLVEGYVFGTFQVTGINTGGTNVTLKGLLVPTPGQVILYDAQHPYTVSSNSYQTTGSGLVSQIPAAGSMIYYMDRIWYVNGQTVAAGDIAGGVAGTLANNYLDSVLSVTENPVAIGGDGFRMPAGNDLITGLAVPQMIDASLGQGLLYIGTPNWVFSLQVPVTRADWIAANSSNQPFVAVVQSGAATGFVNDISVVSINGDLWYLRADSSITSLLTATRYFGQWAGVSVSSNEDFILDQANTSLLNFASGMYFNNRLLMLTLPQQTPFGVVHTAVIPLDLTTISTLEQQDPPNWEGSYDGLQFFQISTVTYSTKQRAFGTVLNSSVSGQLEIWEFVPNVVGDNNGVQTNRIQWQPTFPGFDFGKLFELKELLAGELWIDNLQGIVDFSIEYAPDGSGCWQKWYAFRVCSAMDSTQLPNPQSYPVITFQSGIRKPLTLPKPPYACSGQTGRPAAIGYEFQIRMLVKGNCRIRGLRLHGSIRPKALYSDIA